MSSLNERFLEFLAEGKALPAPRPWRGVLALLIGALLFLAALFIATNHRRLFAAPLFPMSLWFFSRGVLALFRMALTQSLAQRTRRVAENGQRLSAYLVRSHDALYRPGSEVRPCQVLISFQPEVGGDQEYMRHLARRWAGTIRSSERYKRSRRVRLPHKLTDGSVVYCCDLFVHPGLIATNYLTGQILPVLAEDGERGGIELVPYWLLFPYIELNIGDRQSV
jgi:hypothetical protein